MFALVCACLSCLCYIYSSMPAGLSVTIYHFIVRNFYSLAFTELYDGHINEPDDEKVGI